MAETTIMVAEGSEPRYQWRQYFVITDGRCAIVEMLPALLGGWKFHRIVVQEGADSWGGMSRHEIFAWKMVNGSGARLADGIDAEFQAKLLEKAGLS